MSIPFSTANDSLRTFAPAGGSAAPSTLIVSKVPLPFHATAPSGTGVGDGALASASLDDDTLGEGDNVPEGVNVDTDGDVLDVTGAGDSTSVLGVDSATTGRSGTEQDATSGKHNTAANSTP